METDYLSQVLPYIPGIIIFLVGSVQVETWLKKRKETPNYLQDEANIFHPLVMMFGGALLILLTLFESQKKEVEAMICLTIILIGAGISLLWNYFSLKKRNLKRIDAEITEIFTRQLSKETKIWKASKFTYYPIVKYEINGHEYSRKCKINSSGKNTFKIGDKMDLYYDSQTGTILEKHAHIGLLIAGTIIFVIGALAGLSILSVIL
ncbi:MAG: hypothetical protein IJP69_04080 [Synergistaceae bacterium]|nr:hypothetical protein [Synergistaceae bacterium]MBR0233896.1 hypothetical protein [Synergistaceae bacterium]MBR0253440.1 hypothetical protein [Synergistaceae bacterium]